MTPKQLAEEGLRERLLEAVLAHIEVQPGWPHYDAGRVVVLVLDAIEPAIEAEFKALAEEFRRAAANSEETQRCFKSPPMNRSAMQWERGVREGEAIAFRRAAQMLEEKLNG